METLAVQDDYVQNFMSYVSNHSENITIKKDKNLVLDQYLHEKQKITSNYN